MSPLLKEKNAKKSYRILGFVSVILLGIVSILGSGGGGGGSTTPSTNFVVFMADKDTDGTVELYKYSLATGFATTDTVSKVNGILGGGGNVTSFAISPNRQYIAYVADQDVDNDFELYVVDSGLTAAPVKVSGTLIATGDVSDNPVWAPDNSRIAFRADDTTDEVFRLHTVTPSGASLTVVSGNLVANGDVIDFYMWAPDSSRIAYLADQTTDNVIELYTSPPNTYVDNAKVSGGLVANGNVIGYTWAPNSSRLAYLADQVVDEQFELYTGTIVNGNDIAVGGVNAAGAGADVTAFSWAWDSSRIAYVADINTNDIFEAFTVTPTTPGARVLISNGVTGTKDVVGLPSWAPNSSRVAFLGDINLDGTIELFTSTPTGNETDTINSAPLGGNVATGPIQSTPPAWSPDSTLLVYTAEQDAVGVIEVYRGNANGTGNTKISGTMATDGDASLGVAGEVWAPNGTRVGYRADQLLDGTDELWTSTTISATNNQITNIPAVAAGLQSFGKWAPDSMYVVYASEEDTAGVIELYMSAPDGSTKQKISGTMVGGGNVNTTTFAWAP